MKKLSHDGHRDVFRSDGNPVENIFAKTVVKEISIGPQHTTMMLDSLCMIENKTMLPVFTGKRRKLPKILSFIIAKFDQNNEKMP